LGCGSWFWLISPNHAARDMPRPEWRIFGPLEVCAWGWAAGASTIGTLCRVLLAAARRDIHAAIR